MHRTSQNNEQDEVVRERRKKGRESFTKEYISIKEFSNSGLHRYRWHGIATFLHESGKKNNNRCQFWGMPSSSQFII